MHGKNASPRIRQSDKILTCPCHSHETVCFGYLRSATPSLVLVLIFLH